VEQLLSTKLYIPPTRPQLVLRPRLIERLNESLHRKLTLISAPAGFGKTTLVSEWIASCTRPVAWLSLDEGDNDPTRFLAYLVAALQTVVANIGEGVLRVLQSPQPPTESILTALLNEITTISPNFILVLDDYHVINAKPIDLALNFLIEHLPVQMHLVIITREDPDIPLARLRARDQLNELRAVDLRFTSHEAAEFLNQVMGLDLSAEEVAALEARTEGWIAGLQLAALSMRGREDVPRFIRSFAGDNRYIVDYLVEEVLQRQPERVRSFLLQTSILDRLSGPLCDAVTDQEEGNVLLEALERGNLFVVPLDDKRHWFRYHHLFAEVLQAHLIEERPDQVSSLHRRASEWYEHNGSPADAIRHALAAEDFERAAGLVEMIWPAMDGRFQSATWLGWVKALPDELVRTRPVLSVAYAWALLNGGELEAGEARLRDAEQWLDTTADMSQRPEALSAETRPERSRRMVVVDKVQFRSLPASIATARAYHAQALGDIPGSVKYARRALDLLPEGDHLRRGPAAALLGLSQWASGELEAAHQALADAMAGFQMAGNMHFAISVTYGLADIKIAQGRLREAISTYKRSLHIVAQQGESLVRGTADLYLGLSGLYLEQGDEEAARQHLLRSEELGEQAALPDWPYRFRLAQARIKEIQGDLDGALNLLEEAERFYYRGPVPDVHPIAALKARVWVAQGRLTEALGWVGERGLSPDDDLSYLHEFEHITLARLLIAQSKRDHEERSTHSMREAIELLERLLKAAEEGGRMGSVIGILVLQALAYEAHGDVASALQFLERALILAEPEGYVRIFVDEGLPMATLLREASKHSITPNYVSQLRAAFGKVEHLIGNITPVTPLLIEPLSERELQVLRLLGTELDGPEIARELMVSLNTMRTHTKNIYNKLGVNSRRAAVRRAQELDLL
jgi:LuxR family transcriptional regulator, maltose regulon positive regulatory protein